MFDVFIYLQIFIYLHIFIKTNGLIDYITYPKYDTMMNARFWDRLCGMIVDEFRFTNMNVTMIYTRIIIVNNRFHAKNTSVGHHAQD